MTRSEASRAPQATASERLRRLSPAQAVLLLIAVSGLIRLVLAATVGLGEDESYSVANARVLSLSYVDHPPLHYWMAALSAKLFGSDHPLVVRLPFILMFAGTTWLMFRLTALLFDARAGVWAALALNLAPQLTLAAGSWVLPDGPLDFFLLAGAYVIARLMFAKPEPSAAVLPWLGAGALAGLAMLSKFHGAFLLAGTFAFLIAWKPARRLLVTPGPWLGAAVALALFTPVIAWNMQNEWAGLFFQSRRVANPQDLSLLRVLESIGGQAGYLLPWILAPLAYVWVKALMAGPRAPRSWLLAMLGSGPILAFTLSSILRRSLPHWPIPGWLLIFPLLGAALMRWSEQRPQLVRRTAAGTAALLVVVVGVLASQAATGWLSGVLPPRADPTLALLNWDGLKPVLAERKLLDASTPAVAGPHWIDAGKLNYALGRDVPVLCVCDNEQHFGYLHPAREFAGRNVLLIGRARSIDRFRDTLAQRFERLEPLEPITLSRGGRPALELKVIRGIGLRP